MDQMTSKGLEALETLKFEWVDDKFFQKHELYIPKYENDYDEILKKVEEDEDYQTVEKELKALEIIKKKDVFVWGFIHRKEEIKDFDWSYDYYKTHYGYVHSGYDYEILTEEEYELLKEVLL